MNTCSLFFILGPYGIDGDINGIKLFHRVVLRLPDWGGSAL